MAWVPEFGTSGIRGCVPEELSPKIAWQLGLSVAINFNHQPFLLCHDNRTSSPLLSNAIASGLMAGGSNVLYGGEVITPAVSFYTRQQKLSGAILITGSHIPAHMSGIEVLGNDGAPVDRKFEQKIERLSQSNPAPVNWMNTGKISTISDVGQYWVDKVLTQGDVDLIRQRKFKVVLDAANGTAIPWLVEVIKQLNCTIIGVNMEPSPFYPGRSPNLRVKLLSQAAKMVKETKADIGIAVDGDADRAFFIDDKGRALMGDISGTLLAQIELQRHKGGTIVTPINSSNLVDDIITEHNGRVVRSRVGPPAIVAAVKKHQALFAFEESGKAIYPHLNYLSDSGLATIHLLEHLAKHETSLSTIIDGFPQYHQLKRAIDCPNELKEVVTNHAIREVKEHFTDAKVITLDGVKIIFDDGWLLLRPSGTEPVFRCFAEAQKKIRAQQLLKLGLDWIDHVLKAS
ncbi:MAG: phosphoglucosamine mutase [Candidatus Hermodarchaeota archaeon]|nr:phosphoglucosamine mutase [Candidatus Hermodarchaeota archaeon]